MSWGICQICAMRLLAFWSRLDHVYLRDPRSSVDQYSRSTFRSILDGHSDRYSVSTRSTPDRQLIEGRVSTDSYETVELAHIYETVDCRSKCRWSVDRVSIECRSSVDRGSIEGRSRVSIDNRPQMPLVH